MSKLEDKNSRLLEVLLEEGKITRDDVEKIIQLQEKTHEKADRILLNLGIISEEDLRDALGNLFNLKTWQRKKEEELPVIDCLPQSFLHSNRILPLKQYNGNLDIAITDPSDESLLEVIESTTNKRVNIFIGCEKDIIASINETYEDLTEEDQSAYSIGLDVVDDIEKLKDLALEAPVVRLVNNALNKALEIGASDIHIEMFENKPKLRYRIDGVLIDYPPPTRDVYFASNQQDQNNVKPEHCRKTTASGRQNTPESWRQRDRHQGIRYTNVIWRVHSDAYPGQVKRNS